jgi:DNA-binding transcriptional LysR family regulator
VIENTLTQNGIDTSYFKIEMELNSIEAIKNAVQSGLGAAFVSVSAITKELELDMFHWAKIEGVQVKRTLYMLLNSKRYQSNATKNFKEEILEMFSNPKAKRINLGDKK